MVWKAFPLKYKPILLGGSCSQWRPEYPVSKSKFPLWWNSCGRRVWERRCFRIIKGDSLNWLGYLLFEVYTPPWMAPLGKEQFTAIEARPVLGDRGVKMEWETIASLESVLAVEFLLSPRDQQSRPWGIGFKIPAFVKVESAGIWSSRSTVCTGVRYITSRTYIVHRSTFCVLSSDGG